MRLKIVWNDDDFCRVKPQYDTDKDLFSVSHVLLLIFKTILLYLSKNFPFQLV